MKRPSTLLGCVMMAGLFLAAPAAEAEQVPQEAQLWLELGLRYEPVRRLRLSLEQHVRFDENISRPYALMSDLALRYAPLRWLRLAAGYRIAAELDNDGQSRRRHRLHVDVATRHRLRPVALGFRLRFQEEARGEDDNGEPWRHTLRARAELELRRTPVVDPYVSFEVFVRLADDGTPATLRKLRGTLGMGIDAGAGTLEVAYRLEGHLVDEALVHIILLGWSFDVGLW